MSVSTISLPFEELYLREIKPSPNHIRIEKEGIQELSDSIKRMGLLHPILVRSTSSSFEIVCGHRRFEACKLLGWRKIPCHVVELSDKEAFEVSLVENLERKTMNPFEEGRAFKRYIDESGWGGITELSAKIGKSVSYISRRVGLLNVPQSTVDKLLRRRKNYSVVAEILCLDVQEQLEVVRSFEQEKQEEVTVRRIRSLVKTIKAARSQKNHLVDDRSMWKVQDKKSKLVLRCTDQVISTLRLSLLRLDAVLNKLEKEWVEREILLQYRLTLHNQIDSLIHLRKKFATVRN